MRASQGKRVLVPEMVGDPAASSALADALGVERLDVEP